MAAKRKDSRAKGGRGERAAAKLFTEWWGAEFARTPGSGAFATRQVDSFAWNVEGDLYTHDPSFPLCIECKWVEGWDMSQMLKNDGCIIFEWWRQAIRQCPPDKAPILVFKKNNHPFYCMIQLQDIPQAGRDLLDGKLKTRYFTLPLDSVDTGSHGMLVAIMPLSDLFKVEPEIWKKPSLTPSQT